MSKEDLPQPNYEKVRSIDECDKKILDTQRSIAKKYKLRRQAETAKTDMTQSYNEQIKHLKQELDHFLGVQSGWEARRQVLAARGSTEDDQPGDDDQQSAAVAPPPPPAPPAMSPPVASVQRPTTVSIPMPPPPPASFVPPPPPQHQQAAGSNGSNMVPFPVKTPSSAA